MAADESCRSAADARRIAENGIANVLNIKLAKCGVAEALETVAIAKEHGLELMMGGMVRISCFTKSQCVKLGPSCYPALSWN